MKKPFVYLLFCLLLILIIPANTLASSLAGRILLQVEKNGEAYYYHPDTLKLHYLGRPADAFAVMQEQGIGISNADLLKIPVADIKALERTFKDIDSDGDGHDDYTELVNNFNPYGSGSLNYDLSLSQKSSGKIFLQVEANGEAWYINPLDLKRYFLGRPADAFEIMRTLGLGISNDNLFALGLKEGNNRHYTWTYKNIDYSLSYDFSSELFDQYNQNPKVLTYYQDDVPVDLRAAYYQLFFNLESDDNYTLGLFNQLRFLAQDNNFNQDEELEFIISFIQYLDYDFDKAKNISPTANFPYETLYQQKGICTDTSFLAYLYAQELGYGVAILDFKESNHAALGIKCPIEVSLNNSGYCFVETTNYFPLGMVPSSLNNGQANLEEKEADLFSTDNLGAMEIRLAKDGQTYQQIEVTMEIVDSLKIKQERIKELKALIDDPSIKEKNEIITEHNNLVKEYNELLYNFYQIEALNN